MKKFFICILCCLVSVFGFCGSSGIDVSTNSILIAGQSGFMPESVVLLSQWSTSTVYTAGQLVRNGFDIYCCVVGGTSGSTAPVGLDFVSDGTVVWRRCLTRKRDGLVVVNDSPSVVYISLGYSPAVVGQGIRLNANGGSATFVGPYYYAGAVYAVSSGTNGHVTVMEY